MTERLAPRDSAVPGLLTREELYALEMHAEDRGDFDTVSVIRGRLRTCCAHCDKEGATERYDGEGIYVTRSHDDCLTDDDRHKMAYRWQPGDEPLDED